MSSCWACSRGFTAEHAKIAEKKVAENRELGPKVGNRFLAISAVNRLCFRDFSAANAGGANAHALGGCTHTGVYGTQIHVPAPLGHIMGVADAVS